MRKFKSILLFTVISIVLILVIALSYITFALPNVGDAENIKIELTPQKIARGKYLVNHISLCVDCHSKRDWTKFAGPTLNSDSLGGGGEVFDSKIGFPGAVYSPNITPFNLKGWTDGEIFRAITSGVRKDGSAIFPLMPWPYYSKMDKEDIYAMIAYIRTLKPIATSYSKSKLNFPLNILVHTMPEKAILSNIPSPEDTVKYGGYLLNASGCKDCHSQAENGKIIPGLEFAGGHEYKINNVTVRSANITPDKTTGIGNWTEAAFLQRFKAFGGPSKATHVKTTDFQTIMPWYDYAGMSEGDLKSIYAYLKTVKPISNKVVKYQMNNEIAKN